MTHAVIQFALSALAIIIAGVLLTKCADAISDRTKLGKALVGAIFLAGATSLPELFVDISAVRNNMTNLAIGDLFGSSLFNIMILAIADLLHQNKNSMFSKASEGHAIGALFSIVITAVAGMAVLSGSTLQNITFGNIGLSTIAIIVTYVFGIRMIYAHQKSLLIKVTDSPTDLSKIMSLPGAITGYLVSAGILVVAAPYLAEAAGKIANLSGIGKTFIGTTLVAFSTSLPEIVSTLAAVRIGAFDLAIGNIFGSNAFNMVIFFPLDFIREGSIFSSASPGHALTAMAVIVTTAIAAMGQLYQVENRKRFIEPDAFSILLISVGFLTLLYFYG